MGKKGKQSGNKAAVKAAKKQKQAKKVEQKAKKKQGADAGGEEDLLVTLEEFRKKWEEDHKVTEDVVDGPPSRRANASLTADPVNPYLWLFGGEFFDGTNAYFYNDFYRYSPDKNEWRRFSSPTFPGPRSAHQMVGTPAGGGKLWLFGGEFASQNQTSFHHYRDLWCFDLSTNSWERIETKNKPSARSGHRMAVWKQWIVLFGGFHDAGIRTNYLNDLWVFDTLEYRWHQCVTKETERWPNPRSGFSLLSATEGLVLHGGYCKKYTTKTKFEGVPLDDTYFLRLDPGGDWSKLKWEKRKRVGQVPSLRSGATMTAWANKQMGVGFGGVKDVEDEESLTSEFYQDLFGYQLSGNGRWVSLRLRKKKKPGAKRKAKPAPTKPTAEDEREPSSSSSEDGLDEEDRAEEERLKREEAAREAAKEAKKPKEKAAEQAAAVPADNDDPESTIPMQRYNAMLAVLRNTLYIYGGIWETADDESGGRDYTLQSFFSLALDKMDRFVCLRDDDIREHEWNEEESESGDDEDDEEGSGSESEEGEGGEEGESVRADGPSEENIAVSEETAVEHEEPEKSALRQQAEVFMGVSKQAERTEEDVLSTPLPGESLAAFYNRSKQYWAQKAHESSDNRGKELRREGFSYAEDRYQEYKPLLEEIERIQAEAGIEAADVQRRTGPGTSGIGVESRNRR